MPFREGRVYVNCSSGHTGEENSPSFGNWSGLPNFPSPLYLCAPHGLQPPMLWSTRALVPVAPLVWEQQWGGLFFGSSQEKGSRGLLFLLSDSIYMGSSGLGVYYPTQAGCVELWKGGEGGKRSTHHHHRDSVSTASVSCPPGSVKNHTFECPWGRWDAVSQLLIRFPSFRALSLSWPDVVVF